MIRWEKDLFCYFRIPHGSGCLSAMLRHHVAIVAQNRQPQTLIKDSVFKERLPFGVLLVVICNHMNQMSYTRFSFKYNLSRLKNHFALWSTMLIDTVMNSVAVIFRHVWGAQCLRLRNHVKQACVHLQRIRWLEGLLNNAGLSSSMEGLIPDVSLDTRFKSSIFKKPVTDAVSSS